MSKKQRKYMPGYEIGVANKAEPRRLFFILNPVAGQYQAERVQTAFAVRR